MKIAVDLDEVLGEFIGELLIWHNHKYGTHWTLEDVSDYHWSNWMNITPEQAINDVHEFFKTESFASLPVIKGAQAGIAILSQNHQLYLVTARQNVVKEITKAWIDKHYPNAFRDIVYGNHYSMDGSSGESKGKLCNELGCEVIIEDNFYHADDLLNYNVRIVLLTKPWNKDFELPPQSIRVNDWSEIVKAVDAIAQTSVTV